MCTSSMTRLERPICSPWDVEDLGLPSPNFLPRMDTELTCYHSRSPSKKHVKPYLDTVSASYHIYTCITERFWLRAWLGSAALLSYWDPQCLCQNRSWVEPTGKKLTRCLCKCTGSGLSALHQQKPAYSICMTWTAVPQSEPAALRVQSVTLQSRHVSQKSHRQFQLSHPCSTQHGIHNAQNRFPSLFRFKFALWATLIRYPLVN